MSLEYADEGDYENDSENFFMARLTNNMHGSTAHRTVRRARTWSDEEDDALLVGIAFHGAHRQQAIAQDSRLRPLLGDDKNNLNIRSRIQTMLYVPGARKPRLFRAIKADDDTLYREAQAAVLVHTILERGWDDTFDFIKSGNEVEQALAWNLLNKTLNEEPSVIIDGLETLFVGLGLKDKLLEDVDLDDGWPGIDVTTPSPDRPGYRVATPRSGTPPLFLGEHSPDASPMAPMAHSFLSATPVRQEGSHLRFEEE
jgi:hypothetical protein